jgi:predicted peroxiredoxin
MANYLLIESRDPFDSNDVANFYGLASGLAKAGNGVTLFLVQNGVLPARQSAASAALAAVAGAGVEVLADEFSLQERGIAAERLVADVSPAPLDRVVDGMAAGHKTIWH